MIGSSVVPGLPNRCVMPSSLSSARKAERPVILFFITVVSSDRRALTRHFRHDDPTCTGAAMDRAHACPARTTTERRVMDKTIKRQSEETERVAHQSSVHRGGTSAGQRGFPVIGRTARPVL